MIQDMCKGERRSASVSLLIVFILVFTGTVQALENIPYVLGNRNHGSSELEDAEDPDMMFAILARLGQTIMRANDLENTKRGLDLGLSRGYSGSQQAKHMMGIAAAGLSGGPGRRRRSQNTYRYGLPY